MDNDKTCKRCNLLKNHTEFRYRKDKNRYESDCKVCEKKRMKE